MYELPPTKGIIGVLAVKAKDKQDATEIATHKIKRKHRIREVKPGYDNVASTNPWV